MKYMKVGNYYCYIEKGNTKLLDSYLISDKELGSVVREIIKARYEKGYKVTRSIESYKREIKAHNRLYKLGIMKKRTKDTDLEEPISKSKERIYSVLGM